MKIEIEQSKLDLMKLQANYGDICIQLEGLQNQAQMLIQQKTMILTEIRQRVAENEKAKAAPPASTKKSKTSGDQNVPAV